MYSTAITAYPFSYSKVGPTFRTAGGIAPTARTYLGCESFTDFFIPRAFSNGFVREHCSEARPRCIKDRLCHLGFGKSCGINITNRDVIKLPDDASREFVQVIPARIRDLGVDRFHEPFFVRSLGFPKFCFKFSVVSFIVDFLTRGKGSEVFQTKINTKTLDWLTDNLFLNIDHDIQKPVTAPVLAEIGSILDLTHRKSARIEYSESVSSKSESVSFPKKITSFERNPSERFFSAPTKVWLFMLASGFCVLLTNRVDRAGVDTKFLGCAARKFVQVKAGGPLLAPLEGLFLHIVAIIPDKINRSGLLVEQTSKRFYAVTVNLNHFCFFTQSSTARRTSSESESPRASESFFSSRKSGTGRKKCVRFMPPCYHTFSRQTNRRFQRSLTSLLSLPGLKAEVSRSKI